MYSFASFPLAVGFWELMSYRISAMQKDRKITVVIEIEKKGDMFISSCPALDVCSQGYTKKEAKEMIIEALDAFIESCDRRGNLEKVLTAACLLCENRNFPKKKMNHSITIPPLKKPVHPHENYTH